MPTLYVVEQGAEIVCDGDRLVVRRGDERQIVLACAKIDDLVIFGNVGLTKKVEMTTKCNDCEQIARVTCITDGRERCEQCAYDNDCCYQCGQLIYGGEKPEWAWGLCRWCYNDNYSQMVDDAADSAFYHGGRG